MGKVPRRAGPTLAERTRQSAQDAAPRRHCWVDGPDGSGPCPGLVVEWRRDGDRWLGRVVYVVADDPHPVLVEQWLPADKLNPA